MNTVARLTGAALSAALLSGPLLVAAPADARSPEPVGFCVGSSATYPWAVGSIWQGKTFNGHGRVSNRVFGSRAVPGTVTRTGPDTWRINYQRTAGLPVTDLIKHRGGGYYTGRILVGGAPAGTFSLRC